MNTAQKWFLLKWILVFVVLMGGLFIDEWILENWDIFRFPFLLVIGIYAVVNSNQRRSDKDARESMHEIVERHPIIKLWMAL